MWRVAGSWWPITGSRTSATAGRTRNRFVGDRHNRRHFASALVRHCRIQLTPKVDCNIGGSRKLTTCMWLAVSLLYVPPGWHVQHLQQIGTAVSCVFPPICRLFGGFIAGRCSCWLQLPLERISDFTISGAPGGWAGRRSFSVRCARLTPDSAVHRALPISGSGR